MDKSTIRLIRTSLTIKPFKKNKIKLKVYSLTLDILQGLTKPTFESTNVDLCQPTPRIALKPGKISLEGSNVKFLNKYI